MINPDFYDRKIQEIFKLMGVETKAIKEMAKATYDKIKYNYSENDLEGALNSILESDYTKITYPILVKNLNNKRAVRLEQEWNERKKKEQEETRGFWERSYSGDCINHKCYSCGQKYCDTIAKFTMDATKIMIGYEPETFDKKERKRLIHEHNQKILNHLDKTFPGMGFNKEFTRKSTITREELKQIIANNGVIPVLIKHVDFVYESEAT